MEQIEIYRPIRYKANYKTYGAINIVQINVHIC